MSAVVPARDEAETVAETVRALYRIPGVGEVIVVDDGSSDPTARRARQAGARLVRLSRGAGKARALGFGARAARGRVLLLADADLGSSAAALAPLCRAVRDAGAHVAVAVPPRGGGAGLGLVRALARWGGALLGGVALAAPLCGQRAMRAELAPWLLGGPARGYGVEVLMNVRAGRRGLRVVEVPAAIRHRASGWSLAGWRHRARQFLDVAHTLLSLAAELPAGRPRPPG